MKTKNLKKKECPVGEVDFWIFNFLPLAIHGKNNSKTKVEKVFFFIFMSSYADMSFFQDCGSGLT
jgi:hypothetical protein